MDKFVVRIPRVEEHHSKRETYIKPLRQMTIEGLKGVVVMDDILHAKMVLTSSDTSLQQKLESLKSIGSKIPGADIIVSTGIGAAVSSLSNHPDAALAAAASRVQLMWREHLQRKANWRSIDVRYDARTQTVRDSARKMLHDALKSDLIAHGRVSKSNRDKVNRKSKTSVDDREKLFDKVNESLLSDVGQVVSTTSLGYSKGIRIDLDGYDSVMSSLHGNSDSEENDSDCENVYPPKHKRSSHISSLESNDASNNDMGKCTAVKQGKNKHINDDRLKYEIEVISVPCNDRKRKYDLLREQINTDEGKYKEYKRQHVERNNESKTLCKDKDKQKKMVHPSKKDVIKHSNHDKHKHKDSKQRKSDVKNKNSDHSQSNRSHNVKDGQHSLCTVSNACRTSSHSSYDKQNVEKNIDNFKNAYDISQHEINTAKHFEKNETELHYNVVGENRANLMAVEDSFDEIVKDFSEYLKEDTNLQESTKTAEINLRSCESEKASARKSQWKDKYRGGHREGEEVTGRKSRSKDKYRGGHREGEEVTGRKSHSKDKHRGGHREGEEVTGRKSHSKDKHRGGHREGEEVIGRKSHSEHKHRGGHREGEEVTGRKSHSEHKHRGDHREGEEGPARKFNSKEVSSKIRHKKNTSESRKHRHTVESDGNTKETLHHSCTKNSSTSSNISHSNSRDCKVSSPLQTDVTATQKNTERSPNEKNKELKKIRKPKFEMMKPNITSASDAPNISKLAEALEWKLFSDKRLVNKSYKKTVRKLVLTLRHQEKVRNKVLSGKCSVEKLIQQCI